MIVASVIWIVAGGLWTRGIVIDELGRIARSNYSICLDEKDISGCSAQFYREWERDVNAVELNGDNAVFNLWPVTSGLASGLFADVDNAIGNSGLQRRLGG